MPTNKAQTTIQLLEPARVDGLQRLALIVDTARTLIAAQERVLDETKAEIVSTYGYGVFQVPGFDVQTQRIEPTAKPVPDMKAIEAFLESNGASMDDFMVPGKPKAAHDRVNVDATI